MRANLKIALAGLAMVASAALAQQAPDAAITPLGNVVRDFDAPQPALNLAPPDRVFVAGLAPGENLAIPAKSATTVDSPCQPDAASYGVCTPVAQKLGPDKSFLGGRNIHASGAAGAGLMAASVMTIEGAAALLEEN